MLEEEIKKKLECEVFFSRRDSFSSSEDSLPIEYNMNALRIQVKLYCRGKRPARPNGIGVSFQGGLIIQSLQYDKRPGYQDYVGELVFYKIFINENIPILPVAKNLYTSVYIKNAMFQYQTSEH